MKLGINPKYSESALGLIRLYLFPKITFNPNETARAKHSGLRVWSESTKTRV